GGVAGSNSPDSTSVGWGVVTGKKYVSGNWALGQISQASRSWLTYSTPKKPRWAWSSSSASVTRPTSSAQITDRYMPVYEGLSAIPSVSAVTAVTNGAQLVCSAAW